MRRIGRSGLVKLPVCVLRNVQTVAVAPKPARVFLMDLNKMKTRYLQCDESFTVRNEVLESLSHLRLMDDVSGVDLKTVMHFSGTLVTFSCPPTTRCVQDVS